MPGVTKLTKPVKPNKPATPKVPVTGGKPATAGTPANPATKGSATGIQKKAAGMAKRTANKPTAPGYNGKSKKKASGPSVGSGKKGMYY
jgi:hypothetical protein